MMLRRKMYLISSYINLNQNVNYKQWRAQSISMTKGQGLRQNVSKY